MSIKTYYHNLVSSQYYGQKPTKSDYSEKPRSTPQKPETYTEKWKRRAWTALPYVPFIIWPMKEIVKDISYMVKTQIARSRNPRVRPHYAYHAYQIGHGAATIALSLYFAKMFGIPVVNRVRALWAFQGKKAFYQSLDNYFQRKLGLPSQEIVPISLIDPKESIKQQLTNYETKVGKLCGEHFLYFKQSGPQEKFLILVSEADHNRAFDPFNPFTSNIDLIYQLSKRFDVKYRTITCVEDIQREIQNATQFGRVMGLMIAAHGSPFSMTLSNHPNIGKLTKDNLSPDLFAGLDPRCVIALESCSTAGGDFGIAYLVACAAKRTTFATSDNSVGITLDNLDPLEFSFERPLLSMRTKKIEPLEE